MSSRSLLSLALAATLVFGCGGDAEPLVVGIEIALPAGAPTNAFLGLLIVQASTEAPAPAADLCIRAVGDVMLARTSRRLVTCHPKATPAR